MNKKNKLELFMQYYLPNIIYVDIINHYYFNWQIYFQFSWLDENSKYSTWIQHLDHLHLQPIYEGIRPIYH